MATKWYGGKLRALWAGLHFSTGNGVAGSLCFLRLGHIVTKRSTEGPGGNGIWVELVPSLSVGGTQLNLGEPHPLRRQPGHSLFRGQEGTFQ